MKLKKGDKVIVIAGRDKGKKGEVLKVLREEDRVVVSGINLVKRHTRPSQVSAGGIVEKELSIHISNVAFLDPKESAPTRVGFKVLDNGKKTRVAKRSGETLDL
ncbi:MAG: 50S ribosomal protein L24 [Alphaproteobacteria bacterium]|nr:50S ribosomal protein L24 [Alphaproteobacteria bacterium]